ncbi:ribbon-helix-helix protein, CopG family [Streptomyces bohaiensis]|uniref:Ribbon-helix-helix protein, CopG family n=1 Tax=Streptomyces bohaiensis TaxID=1431344 RepID=A0ABX1CD28_9ACTN|nr:ribbon-helix-helix protein, CopG family [Streptomyces bohaiensis]NJQ15770.1 ribbon-helix-helix protein, CopG family [Streptomyces bohaiensis]
MTSRVLSLRLDGQLIDRLARHAALRGMSLQDYVAAVLVREDFDERFRDAVDRTERLGGRGQVGQDV